MKKIIAILLLVAVALGAWYWWTPSPPEVAAASEVEIGQGRLAGFAAAHDTYAWLGIPYAEPPVGELRWRAPRPPKSWQGVKEARRFGESCVQRAPGPRTVAGEARISGSEDCLYLNIWAPRQALHDGEPRPVMFWIHGGGNTIGSADLYDASRLAGEQDLVVVSLNYRLGALGWFSHPALRATSEAILDASGNYGTLDLIAGLRWVRDNIATFGGDPQRVTVFGESAGGRNVVSLLAAPRAAGLFHGAIVQSGSTESVSRAQAEDPAQAYPGNSGWVLRELLLRAERADSHRDAGEWLASIADEELMDWLRGLPPERLLRAYPGRGFGMYLLPQLIRDGAVLPDADFLEVFAHPARHNAVPVITGSTRDEMRLFMLGDEDLIRLRFGFLPEVVDAERVARENEYRSGRWTATAVTELAEVLSQRREDVWAYRFDWDELRAFWGLDLGAIFGASHGVDLPFVFGDFEGLPFGLLFDGNNREGAQWLGRRVMSYWAAFARDGDPGRGLDGRYPRWLPWRNDTGDHFLVFDTPPEGVRMSGELVTVDGLKRRLAEDPRYESTAERCETYRVMFRYTRDWREEEYRALGCPSRDSD